MTSSKKPTAEILTSLDEDPKVHFFPWQLDVRNTAASMCKHITPRGLLSVLLDDEQWSAYPANISIDPQGQVVIAPRYTPPVYVEVNDTMSSVVLYVSKTTNDQLLEWTTGEETLKTAIIKSMGSVMRQIFRDPEDGFSLMSIMDIMTAVRTKYGRMKKDTRRELAMRMTTRLTTTEGVDNHISNLKEMFIISKTGGHPIKMSEQVDILRASILGHVLIDQVMKQYDFLNPDESAHTVASIVDYLSDHLPNISNASAAATQANANIMASEVYLSLQAEYKTFKDQQQDKTTDKKKKRNKGKGAKGKGKAKHQKGNRNNKDQGTEKTLKYCHAHGTQHTHTSSECKLMDADKSQFNSAMRSAKDSDHPPGGSTKVLGKAPQ